MSAHAPLSLDLQILRQPNDSTCGPTCLHAVYRYFDDPVELEPLISEIATVEGGGTLAVTLANHALRRGYRVQIFTVNLDVFDPTWFEPRVDIAEKLRQRARFKRNRKFRQVCHGYLEFLELGGIVKMKDLTPRLVRDWLERDRPILTGLSATFLYRCARETGEDDLVPDDVRGETTGHFVVLCGWDREKRLVRIADPYEAEPGHGDRIYWLSVERVINAILLGVLSYDGNLLVIEPPAEAR